MSCISDSASPLPTHMCGPRPKGEYAPGVRLSHRVPISVDIELHGIFVELAEKVRDSGADEYAFAAADLMTVELEIFCRNANDE